MISICSACFSIWGVISQFKISLIFKICNAILYLTPNPFAVFVFIFSLTGIVSCKFFNQIDRLNQFIDRSFFGYLIFGNQILFTFILIFIVNDF